MRHMDKSNIKLIEKIWYICLYKIINIPTLCQNFKTLCLPSWLIIKLLLHGLISHTKLRSKCSSPLLHLFEIIVISFKGVCFSRQSAEYNVSQNTHICCSLCDVLHTGDVLTNVTCPWKQQDGGTVTFVYPIEFAATPLRCKHPN